MKVKPYPKYKDSNISWLGNVPDQWDLARADAKLGYCKENISVEEMGNRKVFHYSIPAVQDTGNGMFEEGNTIDSGKNLITKPVVLISKLNPRKNTVVTAFPNKEMTVCSGEFVQLAPKYCDLKYAEYLFKSELVRQHLSSTVQSVTRSHQRTDPDTIRKIWWGWPTQEEQCVIAAFLDRETGRIDNLISKKQRQIELLQEKRTALISHVVTNGLDPSVKMKDSGVEWLGQIPEQWEAKRLKYVGQAILGLTYDPKDVVNEGQGILVLRSSNVQNGIISLHDNVYVKTEVTEKLITRCGDILIWSRNGSRAWIRRNAKITRMQSDKRLVHL